MHALFFPSSPPCAAWLKPCFSVMCSCFCLLDFMGAFFFMQEMRRPKFPAAFVFWLRLWMPGSQMMLL